MKCYNHKYLEAVAVCVHCGRAICPTCVQTSATERFVCSSACATASEQTENVIATIRQKSVSGTYMSAYFMIGMGAVMFAMAAFLHQELRAWPLTVYIGSTAGGAVVGGLCYLWVAMHKCRSRLPV